VVTTASSPIKYPQFQPHLGGDVEKLVGVLWSSRTFLAVGIFGSSRRFISGASFFFISGTDVAFWARLGTYHWQPTMSGRLWVERQRRRAVDTVWRLKMKGISKISL
jgi:hypothetical protein